MEITRKVIEDCFKEHYRALCLYAWDIVKSEEDAEDVVQGVFAGLLEECAAGKGREVDDARRYLTACVRNAGTRWAQGKRGRVGLEAAEDLPDGEEERMARAEREARMWEWIEGLPRMQREVLLAAKRDGLPYGEIARRFGIAEKTVAEHLRRAVRSLRTAAVKVCMFLFY